MPRWTLRHDRAADSMHAAIAAALITTFLSPVLAYAAVSAVVGYPGTGAVVGLFIAPFFPMVAPLQFAFVFVGALAIGVALPLCRARHIAFFALAGAALAVAAWAMVPALVGLGRSPIFLAKNADAQGMTLVILSMAAAGAANGAIYWFLLDKFSRAAPRPAGRTRLPD